MWGKGSPDRRVSCGQGAKIISFVCPKDGEKASVAGVNRPRGKGDSFSLVEGNGPVRAWRSDRCILIIMDVYDSYQMPPL